jgi:tRNA-2-methylthio-N6-dimethylallyladenosine synthase
MLFDLLADRGYVHARKPDDADLIIVNTCSVRERAERRAMTRLSQYAKIKKPYQQLWVVGCMAQRLGDAIKKDIPETDRIIGAKSLEYVADDIDTYLAGRTQPCEAARETATNISGFLPIMRGCNNYCAYCVVPYVRGREHSISSVKIYEQAKRLTAKGVKEVTLLGQNVTSYRDNSHDFADIIALLHAISGLKRIRFTTSHPKDISDKLIKTIAGLPKVCHHIHLPVQSGSNRILELMNRRYTREHYLQRIDFIRKLIPVVDITTDVMVGFPGETDEDYQQTRSLFKQVEFTKAFMFAYSVREGTKSASMKDRIPDTIKKERLKNLVTLQTDITKKYHREMVGRTAEVLFTQRQKKEEACWMGQDNGCKRVLLSCKDHLAGMILKVDIARSSGMTLIAERILP